MTSGGKWRGRTTPLGNAVLVTVLVAGIPLTVLLLQVDDGGTRQVLLGAYFVLVLLVAVIARVVFERRENR